MTPSQGSWHSARCGRSPIFREQGTGPSLPAQSGRKTGHALRGTGYVGEGTTCWAQYSLEQVG
jgi:hypothetical protein